eukprot:CAMPEP_0185381814 /NCGR_PEP_ID=MMETSP1364-20130426/53645_1 /TAXON_ID=38817 /ORGANISM="Gephyrocapsa oceanica, Strain RCC1303" /LENGTH=59 /DNA_ID=CAMNT_0027983479 /DNA_START=28 /DNA_END=204 /DNA_ORIENTATION=-
MSDARDIRGIDEGAVRIVEALCQVRGQPAADTDAVLLRREAVRVRLCDLGDARCAHEAR